MAERQNLPNMEPKSVLFPSSSSSSSSSSSLSSMSSSFTTSSLSSSSSSSSSTSSSPPAKKSKYPEADKDDCIDEVDEIDCSETLETNERLLSPENVISNVDKKINNKNESLPGTSSHVDNKNKIDNKPIMDINISVGTIINESKNYKDLSLIGDGAYGTVYKAKDITSGNIVALKKVRIPVTDDGLPSSTLREISSLKQLERFEHPNIVKLIDVCQGNLQESPNKNSNNEKSDILNSSLTLWLVFEHIERDLASFISSFKNTPISKKLIKNISNDIITGVDFLHTHRIVHRDLKPQNLLVTRDNKIKIADFGLSKSYDFDMRLTSVVVTLWYRAPEVLLGCTYATPIDLWSIGCILAELNSLNPLFPGSSEGDQLDRIFQVLGTPSCDEWPTDVSLSWDAFPQRKGVSLKTIIPNIDDNALDLITNMLTFNPHVRLTAAQALSHAYFKTES